MTAARWLDRRQPPMPAPLLAAVLAALERSEGVALEDDSPNDGVPHQLARAGLHALDRVARAAPERSTATELLAADALLTYACEAAAEAGPQALDRLLDELGWERFAHLLARTGP